MYFIPLCYNQFTVDSGFIPKKAYKYQIITQFIILAYHSQLVNVFLTLFLISQIATSLALHNLTEPLFFEFFLFTDQKHPGYIRGVLTDSVII